MVYCPIKHALIESEISLIIVQCFPFLPYYMPHSYLSVPLLAVCLSLSFPWRDNSQNSDKTNNILHRHVGAPPISHPLARLSITTAAIAAAVFHNCPASSAIVADCARTHSVLNDVLYIMILAVPIAVGIVCDCFAFI
jgi:hypothetical protein